MFHNILSWFSFYLRATIYKKGAVSKIDYFKYDFFPTFFFFLLKPNSSRSQKIKSRPNEKLKLKKHRQNCEITTF